MNERSKNVLPRILMLPVKLALGFIGFIIVLVLLGLVAIGIENLRGARAWESAKRDHEAAGDPLGMDAIIPRPVPPESNFAETPLLKPLLDYRQGEKQMSANRAEAMEKLKELNLGNAEGMTDRLPDGRFNLAGWQRYFAAGGAGTPADDVLAGLQKWDAELAELETASRRPFARFDIHYKEGFSTLLPHLAQLKGLLRVFELRSAALLAAGNTASALKDIETSERIATSMDGEPLLISMLVEYAGQTFVTRMAWQGLVDHRWNSAELERLQALFAGRSDPLRRYVSAIQGERAFALAGIDPETAKLAEVFSQIQNGQNGPQMEAVGRLVPRGWIRQNQVTIARFYDAVFRNPHTTANQVSLGASDDGIPKVINDRFWPYAILARQLVGSVANAEIKSFRMLAIDRMAVIACALERYRMANGAYPKTLDNLVPQFISALPADPANGGSFAYQPQDEEWYQLASAGPPATKIERPGEKVEVAWAWPAPVASKQRLF